ncbi:hypothetical protein KCP76_04260 [Salmonella enterica subsp. enterica serovar Weltevreden]|nr:hypothetical protein KCP76_04260 [Salmonella enterica subsp. enterica serovar Weltevreden]
MVRLIRGIGDGGDDRCLPRFPRRSAAQIWHQYVACRSGRNDGVAVQPFRFNDSLFWVVNRMMGVSDVKRQMVV